MLGMSGIFGTQPGGQVIAGIGFEELVQEGSRRSGNRSRYCGKPGNTAIRMSMSRTVFQVYVCVVGFPGMAYEVKM